MLGAHHGRLALCRFLLCVCFLQLQLLSSVKGRYGCAIFCCAFVFLYSFNSCQASMGATTVLFSVVRLFSYIASTLVKRQWALQLCCFLLCVCFLQLQLLSSVKGRFGCAVFCCSFVFYSFNSCQASKAASAVLFSVVGLFSIASTLVKRQRPLRLCCFLLWVCFL